MTKHRYYIRKGVHYGTADDMIDYIDNLEAKLAKAVGHLEKLDRLTARDAALVQATLAELKGQYDE